MRGYLAPTQPWFTRPMTPRISQDSLFSLIQFDSNDPHITNFTKDRLPYFKKAIRKYHSIMKKKILKVDLAAEDMDGNYLPEYNSLWFVIQRKDSEGLDLFWNILKEIETRLAPSNK